jgi:hypothetical protein
MLELYHAKSYISRPDPSLLDAQPGSVVVYSQQKN